jgi:hypothetical protein
VSILGTRADWTFVVDPGYNELDVTADNTDARPNSTGTQSLRFPISFLPAGGQAAAVLTGHPTLDAIESTVEFWIRNENPTGSNHEASFGLRVDSTLTGGTRAFVGQREGVPGAIGLETIADNIVKCEAYFPETLSQEWVKCRVSTSDVNGYPSYLVEVFSNGSFKKRAYLVDRSVMAPATSGSYSFGVRNYTSDSSAAARFDDINLFLTGLDLPSPLPLTNGFESADWDNSFVGSWHETDDILKTIKVDSRPDSSGTNSLDILNQDTVDSRSVSVDVAISDGANRDAEIWVKFVGTYSPLELELRKTRDSSSGGEQSFVLKIDPNEANPEQGVVEFIRREVSGDTSLESTFREIKVDTWYGIRVTLQDNTDVDYLVEYNAGTTSPVADGWTEVFLGSDVSSPLFGSEGYVSVSADIDPEGSIRLDDLRTDKV